MPKHPKMGIDIPYPHPRITTRPTPGVPNWSSPRCDGCHRQSMSILPKLLPLPSLADPEMRFYPTLDDLTDISPAGRSWAIHSHTVTEDHPHLWSVSHLHVACSLTIKPPRLEVALVVWYSWLVRIHTSPSWIATSRNSILEHMISQIYYTADLSMDKRQV
ncbi:hypothetical protein LZ32DRAFT_443933 [Colletotrichum eremochloae]|nr:hypothetical protein LZ32DRAFT_443933 [Colletotrichum eremochloae]